jgi:ABC-2 type transport system ATP-binding protein
MLRVLGLEKRFGAFTVLAGADLSAGPGEAIALVGSNGSGKTTTLRCIVGLGRPDAGAIRVAGIDALREPRAARERMSYLPQKPSFPGTLSVREVLAVTARLRRRPPSAAERELQRCGLEDVADRHVSRLSGGERQRVGLAVTFLADVSIYIFDEPSASLDPLGARILIDRARALRADGRTILYTTHVAADIDALASRVALLRHGRVTMFDDHRLDGAANATVRPLTPGEEALRRLEAGHDESVSVRDGLRVVDGNDRLRDRFAGAATVAAGSR